MLLTRKQVQKLAEIVQDEIELEHDPTEPLGGQATIMFDHYDGLQWRISPDGIAEYRDWKTYDPK